MQNAKHRSGNEVRFFANSPICTDYYVWEKWFFRHFSFVGMVIKYVDFNLKINRCYSKLV